MYYQGSGVSKDDREAVRLFKLAADPGNKPAQTYLAQFRKLVTISNIPRHAA